MSKSKLFLNIKEAKMPEDYIVEALIVSVGDVQNIEYEDKKSGQPKAFTKFLLEAQIGDEIHTLQANGKAHTLLEVGSRYTLAIRPNPNERYEDSIRNITFLGKGNGTMPTVTPTPKPVQMPRQPVVNSGVTTTSPRPDFASRWREWNTHARLAQMQATERVSLFVNLAKEGKLQTDDGEVVDALRKNTIESWFTQEIDRYWKELEERIPKDAFGDLGESRKGVDDANDQINQ